jgi:hypothetical protein
MLARHCCFKPMVGRDAGVDGTADSRSLLHGRASDAALSRSPKNLGPFQREPRFLGRIQPLMPPRSTAARDRPLRRTKTRCGRPLGGHTAGRWRYPVRGVGGGAPRSQSPKHQSKKYSLAYIAIMSRSCAEKGRNRERGSFLFMAIGLEYYFQRGTPAKDGAPCADPQFRTLRSASMTYLPRCGRLSMR